MLDRLILRVLEALTLVGAAIGGYLLFASLYEETAVQTGAAAAVALAFVAIPYCLAGIMHRSMVRDRLPRDQ